jgi:hypothetical protein
MTNGSTTDATNCTIVNTTIATIIDAPNFTTTSRIAISTRHLWHTQHAANATATPLFFTTTYATTPAMSITVAIVVL